MTPESEDPLTSRARARVGTVLCRKYRLRRLIGVGGMGAVFDAVHRNGHRVAVKVLHERPSTSADVERLFRREAHLANAVGHPGVVPVIDDDVSEDGSLFLVMPLLEGGTLQERWVEAEKKLPLDEVIAVTVGVLEILEAAHAKKIVHRDIKPGNVFITAGGEIRVFDFGLARFFETNDPASVTRSGRALGTPAFMAPEQALGRWREVDGRTDLWAVGAMVVTLLTGRFVHEAETANEVLVHAATHRAPSIAELVPEVPRGIGEVIDRALRFAKEERWGSAGEMREALVAAYFVAFGHEPSRDAIRAPAARASLKLEGAAAGFHDGAQGGTTAGLRAGITRTMRMRTLGGSVARRTVLGALVLSIAATVGALALRHRGTAQANGTKPSVATSPRCVSNRECTREKGAPARCRADGSCVPLASDDCTVHASAQAADAEDTVWFGALLPDLASTHDYGKTDEDALDLARIEFEKTMGGFTREGSDPKVRPLGFVSCSSDADPRRAARHLVDVGVPAVIGFDTGATFVDVVSEVLLPNHVMAVSSLCTSSLVTSIPQQLGEPRLTWRTTYNTADAVRVLGLALGSVIEPRIRATYAIPESEPIRVAYIRGSFRGTIAFDREIFDSLHFNHGTTFANQANFRQIAIDTSDPQVAEGQVEAAVGEIAAFAPHVVIEVSAMGFFKRLDARWSKTAFRPTYLVISMPTQQHLAWIGTSAERRRRVIGVWPVMTRPPNERFVLHYNEYSTFKATLMDGSNTSYDAFYTLAYASYALRDDPVTGPNLARAMSRIVPPGRAVDVGPDGIFEAFASLRRGENIDLNGAAGPLDFDVTSGESPFDFALVCAGVDSHGRADENVESGEVFRASTQRFEGVFRCP